MNAYHVESPQFGRSHWIDLDHVVAISDVQVQVIDRTGPYPRASFTITFMFSTEPITIGVYDHFDTHTNLDGTVEHVTKILPEEIEKLRRVHQRLLTAWVNAPRTPISQEATVYD